MNAHDRRKQEILDEMWSTQRARHSEASALDVKRSVDEWRRHIWIYRVIAVVMIAGLVWVAFHSDKRTPPMRLDHPVVTVTR